MLSKSVSQCLVNIPDKISQNRSCQINWQTRIDVPSYLAYKYLNDTQLKGYQMSFQERINAAAQSVKVTDVPAWAVCDSTCDITDNWNERSGETINDNETATAFFVHRTNDHDEDEALLVGINVDDGHGAAYYDCKRTIEHLTGAIVQHIETLHSDVAFT